MLRIFLTYVQFNGEVVDAKITNVNKMGFFAEVGPLSIFVSSHLLPIDYKFHPDSNPPEFTSPTDVRMKNVWLTTRVLWKVGAFVYVLWVLAWMPMRLYVFYRLYGPDLVFSFFPLLLICYCTFIQFAIGTMKEDYLGPFD